MIFWKKKKPAAESEASSIPKGQTPVGGLAPSNVDGLAQGESSDSSKAGSASGAAGQGAAERGVVGQPGAADQGTTNVGWFRRALQKTTTLFRTDIRDLWKSDADGELVDNAFLDKLYAILIRTDMGPSMATRIRDDISDQYRARRVREEEVLGESSDVGEQADGYFGCWGQWIWQDDIDCEVSLSIASEWEAGVVSGGRYVPSGGGRAIEGLVGAYRLRDCDG